MARLIKINRAGGRNRFRQSETSGRIAAQDRLPKRRQTTHVSTPRTGRMPSLVDIENL
jgi:hypothetical protein